MQKTKIEWCDATWNPVTGCNRGCPYCYARRIAKRFGGCDTPVSTREILQPLSVTRKNGQIVYAPFPFGFVPTFHRYRLEEPQHKKKPQNVFVCSMGDLFGPWVPTKWIAEVMYVCLKNPQHRYLFLTKYPERYLELDGLGGLPHKENFWYGSTATNEKSIAMYPEEDEINAFWSIEPILGPVDITKADGLPRWIILGAMTGPGAKKYQPAREWIEDIVSDCQHREIPVFMKNSLIPVWGDDLIRQFPWDAP